MQHRMLGSAKDEYTATGATGVGCWLVHKLDRIFVTAQLVKTYMLSLSRNLKNPNQLDRFLARQHAVQLCIPVKANALQGMLSAPSPPPTSTHPRLSARAWLTAV